MIVSDWNDLSDWSDLSDCDIILNLLYFYVFLYCSCMFSVKLTSFL